MIRMLTVIGTRPEAIKLAPVLSELQNHSERICSKTCVTGQHRDMLDPLIRLFSLRVDYDLDLMQRGQTLEHIAMGVMHGVGRILREERFDLLLVQGDTTTSMSAALAAFHHGVKVAHVEAGLRTFDKLQPYPEEGNRRIIDAVADLYFCPTERSRRNLLDEGVAPERIVISGNTVVDAAIAMAARPCDFTGSPIAPLLADGRRLLLATAHRRESFGPPLQSICDGLAELARRYQSSTVLVCPVHRNPLAAETVRARLSGIPNLVLTEPLDYLAMVHLMKRSALVLTDSGGLQEEAPSFGVPVLVMREVTERPEGITAGTARMVGTDADAIVEEASRLLDDEEARQAMIVGSNPYGDGEARFRIVRGILDETWR